jgi:hypothetical protein
MQRNVCCWQKHLFCHYETNCPGYQRLPPARDRWPIGERLQQTQRNFQELCGLPAVVGAIDGTHISIAKLRFGAEGYYYFKSGGYTLNCQAVVDSNKRFLDLYLGMPGSTNDAKVL